MKPVNPFLHKLCWWLHCPQFVLAPAMADEVLMVTMNVADQSRSLGAGPSGCVSVF